MKTLWPLLQPGGLGGVSEPVAGVSLGLDLISLVGVGGGGLGVGGALGPAEVAVCVQVCLARGRGEWLESVSGEDGRAATSETDAHSSCWKGGLEEQATTSSVHPSLILGPHPPSSQPGKMEVWAKAKAKASQPAPVRLSSSSSALRN